MPRLRPRAIVSALPEAIRSDFEEQAYRMYLTDAIYAVNANTAHRNGSYIEKRFRAILHPEEEDTRTGDDIARDVMEAAGLRFK